MVLVLEGRNSYSKPNCQALGNLRDKAKIYGTLNVVKHNSLVFIWLYYKKSW